MSTCLPIRRDAILRHSILWAATLSFTGLGLASAAPPPPWPYPGPQVAPPPPVMPEDVVHPDGSLVGQPGWFGAPPLPLRGDDPSLYTAPSMPVPVTPGTNRYAVSPPPGTLGQTYRQRSALIPDDKHPRVGIVEVHLPEDVDVSGRELKSTWTGEVWRLESKEPLLPGLPHIYAIKAEKRNAAGEVTSTEVRWVRLIMGRVVDLKF